MVNLQYIISSFLLIIPFVIAGIIDATYDKLFLKNGKVLELSKATLTGGWTCTLNSGGYKSSFLLSDGGTNYYLIGSNNPYVFFASDGVTPPANQGDYKNRIEVKFTSNLGFNLLLNGNQLTTGTFPTKREFLPDQFLLYEYNYGEWLAVILVAVFGVTLFRILNKELTISNIVQAAKKFRIGLFGVDTSLESGKGVTIIKALKTLANFLGWLVSFFIFPTSNLMFYLSFITIFITFLISFGMTTEKYITSGKWSAEWKGAAAGIFIGVLVLFISFRYISDRSDPESIVVKEASKIGTRGVEDINRAINNNQRISSADASAIARAAVAQ